MLKKLFNIVIIILLLITTSGYTVSEHYCGDNLVSVGFNKNAQSCCDNDACKNCHNESHHFHLKDNFVSTIEYFNIENKSLLVVEFPLNHYLYSFINDERFHSIIISDISPPPKTTKTVLANLHTYLL